MGGHAIHELGFLYILFPVAMNAASMLMLAAAINYPFRWRRYPAVLIQRRENKNAAVDIVSDADHRKFVSAVRSLDSFVDVSEEDLVYLTRLMAEHQANMKDNSSRG